jgi:peptidoglycan/xylan/chitin deacetylase (PgdA/CDA1 family)
MSNGQRRSGRLLVVALLLGALSVTAPPGQAAPKAPPPEPSSRSLPAGPWPPSEVLAADPATVPSPPITAQVVAGCPAAGYGVNHDAPGSGKTVALTFDDGPGVSTDAIMQILKNAGVAGTFFNIGVNETVRPATVRAQAASGFLLGNHTWSHPDLTTLSSSSQAAEMDKMTAEQVSLVGSPPCFFRPPYGSYNSTTLSLAQSRNMQVFNWSVDTEDWKAAGSGSSAWVNRIISLAQAGGSQSHPVVLMHNSPAGNPATVAALPTIIKFYRDRGYTFVDLVGRVANRLPIGAFDWARIDGAGRITISGWTIDPDTPTVSTPVHVYVDGRGKPITANVSRPDVGAAYPGAGNMHGFSTAVDAGPGTHTVCVYPIDTSSTALHSSLGCRTVATRLPIGRLDGAGADGTGRVTVRGWTIDPDTPTVSTPVHVYVDGHGNAITANLPRPDVAAAYPGAGNLHGFAAAFQTTPGTHTVCVYPIDTSYSSLHSGLGCRTLTVTPRVPFGWLDWARVDAAGRVTVGGWTIDPDTPTVSTPVHVYVDGRLTVITANISRPDVGAAYPGAGNLHGFTAAVEAGAGVHTVCIYPIDTSFSSLHSAFGCRTPTNG